MLLSCAPSRSCDTLLLCFHRHVLLLPLESIRAVCGCVCPSVGGVPPKVSAAMRR